MIRLTNLTNNSFQKYILVGEGQEQINFELSFLPTQNQWFFNISYLDFALNGMLLNVARNVMYQYRHLLPFGLMCLSDDGFDPMFIDDFSSERIKLYLLNRNEI